MCDLYKLLLEVPDEKIAGQTFNAGFMNMSIMEIAQIAKRVVQEMFPEKGDIPIVTTPTDDIRSYQVNSDKIKRVLGFEPSARSRTRSATCAWRSRQASCPTACRTRSTSTSGA
jgi:nucleoside-diphosphate-sugar epimerase